MHALDGMKYVTDDTIKRTWQMENGKGTATVKMDAYSSFTCDCREGKKGHYCKHIHAALTDLMEGGK